MSDPQIHKSLSPMLPRCKCFFLVAMRSRAISPKFEFSNVFTLTRGNMASVIRDLIKIREDEIYVL